MFFIFITSHVLDVYCSSDHTVWTKGTIWLRRANLGRRHPIVVVDPNPNPVGISVLERIGSTADRFATPIVGCNGRHLGRNGRGRRIRLECGPFGRGSVCLGHIDRANTELRPIRQRSRCRPFSAIQELPKHRWRSRCFSTRLEFGHDVEFRSFESEPGR